MTMEVDETRDEGSSEGDSGAGMDWDQNGVLVKILATGTTFRLRYGTFFLFLFEGMRWADTLFC